MYQPTGNIIAEAHTPAILQPSVRSKDVPAFKEKLDSP